MNNLPDVVIPRKIRLYFFSSSSLTLQRSHALFLLLLLLLLLFLPALLRKRRIVIGDKRLTTPRNRTEFSRNARQTINNGEKFL